MDRILHQAVQLPCDTRTNAIDRIAYRYAELSRNFSILLKSYGGSLPGTPRPPGPPGPSGFNGFGIPRCGVKGSNIIPPPRENGSKSDLPMFRGSA